MFIFDYFTPELLQESFVLLHHHKTLQLLVEFETYRYDNQHSGCGHGRDQRLVFESEYREQQTGDERDEREIDSTEQRDTLGYFVEKFVRAAASFLQLRRV